MMEDFTWLEPLHHRTSTVVISRDNESIAATLEFRNVTVTLTHRLDEPEQVYRYVSNTHSGFAPEVEERVDRKAAYARMSAL